MTNKLQTLSYQLANENSNRFTLETLYSLSSKLGTNHKDLAETMIKLTELGLNRFYPNTATKCNNFLRYKVQIQKTNNHSIYKKIFGTTHPSPTLQVTKTEFNLEDISLMKKILYSEDFDIHENLVPYYLLPLFDTIAFFFKASNTPPFTYGTLLKMYAKRIGKSPTPLTRYPLLHFVREIKPPEWHLQDVPSTCSFRDFVVQMTLASIERTLHYQFEDHFKIMVETALRENESLCQTITQLLVDPNHTIPPLDKTNPQNEVPLKFHLIAKILHESNRENNCSKEDKDLLVQWIIASDFTELCLACFNNDKDDIEPRLDQIHLILEKVHTFKALYARNHEKFEHHAASLFFFLCRYKRYLLNDVVDFFNHFNALSFSCITTDQILQLDHSSINYHDLKIQITGDLLKSLPLDRLEGIDKNSYRLIQTLTEWKTEPLIEKIKGFHILLKLNDNPSSKIDSERYFNALFFFINGDITHRHFEILEMFKDEISFVRHLNDVLEILTQSVIQTSPNIRNRWIRALSFNNQFDDISSFKQLLMEELPQLSFSEDGWKFLYCCSLKIGLYSKGHPPLTSLSKNWIVHLKEKRSPPFSDGELLHIFYERVGNPETIASVYRLSRIIKNLEYFLQTPLKKEIQYKLLVSPLTALDVLENALSNLSQLQQQLIKKVDTTIIP